MDIQKNYINDEEIEKLMDECQVVEEAIDLTHARELSELAGFSVESTFFNKEITTGGHNNTNHIVVWTKDYTTDRIAELSRGLQKRMAKQKPEHKQDSRWDKRKQAGERRRRIARPEDAPPDAPKSAYTMFLSQMTTKIRHDRPNQVHSQALAAQEISRLWKALPAQEKCHYAEMHQYLQEEQKKQLLEFRATGRYTPSDRYEKLGTSQLWITRREEDRNELEREIASYETVTFRPRPPELDAEYERRQKESVERRKRKLREDRRAMNAGQKRKASVFKKEDGDEEEEFVEDDEDDDEDEEEFEGESEEEESDVPDELPSHNADGTSSADEESDVLHMEPI